MPPFLATAFLFSLALLTASTLALAFNGPGQTGPPLLKPSSSPSTGLVPQCNDYESVLQTDADNAQASLVAGTSDGLPLSCCTTAKNACTLVTSNGTAAVQLCSTGGAQCAQCRDLAAAMKALVTVCSTTLLTGTAHVGGQVAIPWMVNTTLQLNPEQKSQLLGVLGRAQ